LFPFLEIPSPRFLIQGERSDSVDYLLIRGRSASLVEGSLLSSGEKKERLKESTEEGKVRVNLFFGWLRLSRGLPVGLDTVLGSSHDKEAGENM
jgi:hypothetical protein